jgi:DNA-binding response OmpR family regulator
MALTVSVCSSTSSETSSGGVADRAAGERPHAAAVECCNVSAAWSRAVPNSFRIGEFYVEPTLHRVSGPAGTVRLEPKVMLVLLCLAEHSDEVVPKERLMRAVWPTRSSATTY